MTQVLAPPRNYVWMKRKHRSKRRIKPAHLNHCLEGILVIFFFLLLNIWNNNHKIEEKEKEKNTGQSETQKNIKAYLKVREIFKEWLQRKQKWSNQD